ncbi:MAG: hypothetical protein ABL878_18655, partial [Burkholderiales bacterium]
VVAGVPARRVGRPQMSVAMLKAKNQMFPWRDLIERRAREFDPELEPELEPELVRMGVKYFYGSDKANKDSFPESHGNSTFPTEPE